MDSGKSIIELAKQAGLKVATNISGVTLVGSPAEIGLAHITLEEMGRFANLVLEEAAMKCEQYAKHKLEEEMPIAYVYGARECAESIRWMKGQT